MAYEKIILIPSGRTSDAGGASIQANSMVDRGTLQAWDLAKGCPGIELCLYPPGSGTAGPDYESYREKIVASFARFGYEIPKAEEPIRVEIANEAVSMVTSGDVGN
jgi:hypothetical protein